MNRREFVRAGLSIGLAGASGAVSASSAGWRGRTAEGTAVDELLLNSNENPLGLPPEARTAVEGMVQAAHRYPDAARDQLEAKLAASQGLEPENVVLGNGSTEILQMIVQAASSPNAGLVLADPTFEAMSRYQRPLPYRIVKVPLDAAYGHDLGRMRELVEASRRPQVVYLCNPNNPTGTLTSSAAIDTWIEAAPETVLFAVDEAYFEYVTAPGYWSAVKWVRERPNVIVVRTFSKIYAMAGLRLGYAYAHQATASRLREFMSSDNANTLALAAALACVDDEDWIARSRRANLQSMGHVQRVLDELGLGYLPSYTNFLMHQVAGDLPTYILEMRRRGLRVGRPFPPLIGYNRLSMGLPEEMERVTDAWRELRAAGEF